MPSRRHTPTPAASAVPYRSPACRIGTHQACAESSPAPAPADMPLIYEACACPCHSASSQAGPAEAKQ